MVTKRGFLICWSRGTKVGMASDLYATYPVVKRFDTTNRILGYDLRELIG